MMHRPLGGDERLRLFIGLDLLLVAPLHPELPLLSLGRGVSPSRGLTSVAMEGTVGRSLQAHL